MSSPVLAVDQPEENAAYYAKVALAMMEKHGVPPRPENFAVWYEFSRSLNKELVHEINTIINNALKFTKETNIYLYNKYIQGTRSQKALDDATVGAQKILLEVFRVINDFSGETQNYNKDIDQYIETVGGELADESVRGIVKELIAATSNLKQSGAKLNRKLEESTNEINALRKNLQQVTTEAQRDFLTGVFNRKTFERIVDDQMQQAVARGTELCLLMIDIDHFKSFNDRFGHLLGDEVLKIVARTLMEVLKGRDVVARYGGEEFVVILPETPVEASGRVADMIRSSIASKQLKRRDTGEVYGTITVSIGVARYRAGEDTLPTWFKRADDALYQAKHNGRNQTVIEPLGEQEAPAS